MTKKEKGLCKLLGIISGLLLAITNIFPACALLQLVALLPILYIAGNEKFRGRAVLEAGIYMGLAYILPQMIVLRLPVAIALIHIFIYTVLMAVFAWGSSKLMRYSGLAGAFAIGALLVLLDWANFTFVPIWGTAQSLARPWSWYPGLIQFESITGITGIIFVLGVIQALIAKFIFLKKQRKKILIAIIILILVIAAINIFVLSQRPVGKMKVAAIGWTRDDAADCGGVYSKEGFKTLYAEPVAQAAAKGARLIVSPEFAFYMPSHQQEKRLEKFRKIAQEHNVFLAIGYYDSRRNENRAMLMRPDGTVAGKYTKTHLLFIENFNKGEGKLVKIDVDGFATGMMICHDDNFTRLSREYGRKKAALIAVLTFDWWEVKSAHLQNCIHRAIESRYAIVRATIDGISAIISPEGEIVAYKDHFLEGPGIIVAEVRLYSTSSLFSTAGHWPVIPSFLFIAIYASKRVRFRTKKM